MQLRRSCSGVDQPTHKTASIHHIITEERGIKLQQSIQKLFKPQYYSIFPIQDLKSSPNYNNDHAFHELVSQLHNWNSKVQKGMNQRDVKSELTRNKYIYTSLKNILANSTKGTDCYQINIGRLYEWYKKNCEEKMPMYYSSRKKVKPDDDWQVRKTFKSNMPLQLKNYQRRALFTTEADISHLKIQVTKKVQPQKLLEYESIRNYRVQQLKQRQQKQEAEIIKSKTLLKSKKCRFGEQNCKNIQLFQGKFNGQFKNLTNYLGRSSANAVSTPKIPYRQKQSYSFIDNEKIEVQKIKKYRFNSALIRKSNKLFRDKQINFNKTTKSFMSSKTINNPINPAKEYDQNLGSKSLIEQQKENKQLGFLNQFVQLKNCQGNQLMSNPFQKKKLKKKKKK